VSASANWWCIPLNRIDNRSRKLSAKAVVICASEVGSQVFFRLTRRKITAQQPLNGIWNLICRCAIA
jgi:hypothetical protein